MSNQLLEALQNVHDNAASGALRLERGDQHITVHFAKGAVAAVASNIADLQLGRFLARRGILNGTRIESLLADARKQRVCLGEAAVARRLIEAPDLAVLVQEQVVAVLAYALEHAFEAGRFERRRESFHLPADMDFDRLLLELARARIEPLSLEPHKSVMLRVGAAIPRLPWLPHELMVLAALEEPRTFGELAGITGLDEGRLARFLGVLDGMYLLGRAEIAAGGSTAAARHRIASFESLMPEIPGKNVDERLRASMEQSAFVAEQFRTLKVRLQEHHATRPVRVIAVSSADVGAGKSFVSLNLAFSFSRELERRVLLIDGDLRTPSVHRYLGTTVAPGLLGCLETGGLEPYCFMRKLDGLFVLTAGGSPPDPVEMLSQDRMRQLMDLLRSSFDVIVIDAPPLVPISDTQVLSSYSDGMLLVVRSGRTTFPDLEGALRLVPEDRRLGVVLNDVQPLMFHTAHDYRYYGGAARRYPYAPKHRVPGRKGRL